jgi:hypothetical protein
MELIQGKRMTLFFEYRKLRSLIVASNICSAICFNHQKRTFITSIICSDPPSAAFFRKYTLQIKMAASQVPSTAIEEYYQLYLLLHTPAEAIMMPTTGKRSKTSNDKFSSTNATQTTRLIVPTVSNKNNTEELDLHFMTEEELKMLQKKGMLLPFPFLPRQRSTLTVLLIVITHTRQ